MPSPRWSRQRPARRPRPSWPAPSWQRPSWPEPRQRGLLGRRLLGGGLLGRRLGGVVGLDGALALGGSDRRDAAGISRVARSGSSPALALGRPGDVLGERGLGEDDLVGDQHVVGVELAGLDQVHLRHVAQAHPVEDVVAVEHDQHALGLRDRRPASPARPSSSGRRRRRTRRPRAPGPRGPGRRGHRAGRRPSSSSGSSACSRAASGRRPCHRRRTAARGSSPDGRGRCPSGGRAWRHHR